MKPPAGACSKDKLVLPAYEQMVKASHAFNLLDARHAVSVTERQRFILRVRTLARGVAEGVSRQPRGAGVSAAQERGRRARCRMSAQDLLFELRTEELPPRTLPALSTALDRGRASRASMPPAFRMARFRASRRRAGSPCGSKSWRNTSPTDKWSGADRRCKAAFDAQGRTDAGRRRPSPRIAASPSASSPSSRPTRARG